MNNVGLQGLFGRLLGCAVLILFLSGKNYCREDYELASQSSSTATPTPTPTDDDSGVVDTPTPTPTPDDDDEDDDSTDDTDDDDDDEDDDTETETLSLFRELGALGVKNDSTSDSISTSQDGVISLKSLADLSSTNGTAKGNWLGRLYEDDSELLGSGQDSDGDGYTDRLEQDFGTEIDNPNSTPPAPVSRLSIRMQQIDRDLDGLGYNEELSAGTDPEDQDSDGDGVIDGAEVLSQSNPLDASSRPEDLDGDGLSNDYENEIGTNPQSKDTDRDGLSDGLEVVLSSEPNSADTDFDGILDGKEVSLGGDPTIPEYRG